MSNYIYNLNSSVLKLKLLQSLESGENDVISTEAAIESGVFCKIFSNDGSKLDLSKLSFVMYYGVVENSIYSESLFTENIEYKFTETIEDGVSYINAVYYKPDEFEDWGQNDIIIKLYINYDATVFSNVVSSDASQFAQTNTVVHEMPVSKPFYKTNSNVIYIEDSLYNANNEKSRYTYVSKIMTNNGYNIFGVKRQQYFAGNAVADETKTKEITNINANVVKLKPNTTQIQIYSFKNGPQYMELSNDAFMHGMSNNGKLIPYYLQSYEYKIDGLIPQDKYNDFNISFYGATGYISSGSISAHLPEISDIFSQLHSTLTTDEETNMLDMLLSYSFVVPYSYTKAFDNDDQNVFSYTKVRNQEEVSKRISDSPLFENTYCTLSNYYQNVSNDVLRQYADALDIYERKTTYIKLDNSLYNKSSLANDRCKYYEYDTKTMSYNEISSAGNASINDVYVQITSYSKISSNIRTSIVNGNDDINAIYDDTNVVKYVQLYEYDQIEKTSADLKSLFYVKKEIANGHNAYYPIQAGIVNDESIEYYGFSYIKLTDDKVREYKNAQNAPDIYIKQQYKKVLLSDFSRLTENDMLNLYMIEDDVVHIEDIPNTTTIFDFDINDTSVIYAKNENGEKIPLDKNELEDIYYNNSDWFLKNKQKEISTNKLDNYTLPSNYNIVATVDYNGKWVSFDYSSVDEIKFNELVSTGKIYLKQESYNKIPTSKLVAGYDIGFYVWGIGKINPNKIKNVSYTYANATKYVSGQPVGVISPYYEYKVGNETIHVDYEPNVVLSAIDKNGFIECLEYFTRTPVKSLSNDLYLVNFKEYYAVNEYNNSNKEVVHGNSVMLPIAYLGIKAPDDSMTWSLMNYWNKLQLNDDDENPEYEDPIYTTYIKLRNDTARLLFDSNCCCLSYSVPAINAKYDVNYIGNSYVSPEASYFLKLNTYSGNNYLDINSVLQGSYEYCIDINQYKSGYEFSWDKIKFFKDSTSHYLLSDKYKLVTDISGFDKKYLYSKYFYQNFTNNNGVHQAKDGSYYTTITIFDGTRGTLSKSLFLQPNIFNVTEYTYNYTGDAYIPVDIDDDLTNVPQSEYGNYYYKDNNNNYVQLKDEDKSPAYYFSMLTANQQYLYKHCFKEIEAPYDGRNTGPLNKLQVQYIDNNTYSPKIIKKNDNLYGIIFNVDLTSTNETQIIDSETNMFVGPFDDLIEYQYEYDVVQLKEYIVHDSTSNDESVVLQSQHIEQNNITIPTPFYLANEKQALFDGSYTWNMPTHGYVFSKNANNDYVAYDIIKEDGYWQRNYDIAPIPFIVASYNFYSDPSKISNTTLSYTFTPESKIVTEIIEHPEISYKTIYKENHEVTRFKYIYKGIEHEYPSDGKIQENNDGTYYGVIEINGKQMLINLIKYIDVDFVNTVKNVVHQEHDITYKYSSYKTSIALTNEKVPVLYNTELIPATSHKILYWNEDVSSYAIKTVIDSYAHYAYNYYYDIVPFVTTSYMKQDSAFVIDHVDDISNNLSLLANGITDSLSQVSQSVSNVPSALNEIKSALSNSNSIGTYIESFSNNVVEALNNLQSNAANGTNNGENVQINIDSITQSIDNQSNTLSSYLNKIEPKLFDINKTINDKLIDIKNDISNLSTFFESNSKSISEIIEAGFSNKDAVTYEEFMVELTKEMYAKIDFDADIIDVEQKDENGNMISKAKHKANPVDLAKKTIYRADILWQELKKKNIVS